MALTILDSPNELLASRNHAAWRISADSTWETLVNYCCKVSVEYEPVYRSGIYVSLIAFFEYPDPAGEMVFDLAEILNRKVLPESPEGITAPTRAEQLCTRYRITFQEFYDYSLQSSLASSVHFVVRAGFPRRHGQYLLAWRNAGRFLTHAPTSKVVSTNQQEWLYYIVRPGITDIFLQVKVTYSDDTVESSAVAWTSTAFLENDVIRFPVGFKALGLDLLANPVKSWTVQVMKSAIPPSAASEIRTYVLDCHYSPLERFFLFENSLGGWDMLRSTGKAVLKQNTESSYARRRVGPYAAYNAFEDLPYQTRNYDSVEQPIGFQTNEEQTWLRDLLRTDRAYRIGDHPHPNAAGTGDWTPIVIRRESAVIFEDEEFMNPLSFSYTESQRQRGTDTGGASTQ